MFMYGFGGLKTSCFKQTVKAHLKHFKHEKMLPSEMMTERYGTLWSFVLVNFFYLLI